MCFFVSQDHHKTDFLGERRILFLEGHKLAFQKLFYSRSQKSNLKVFEGF